MKILIVFVFALFLFTLNSITYAGTAMKQEGYCTGHLEDGTEVSFTYFSNFNGCRQNSRAAISYQSGLDGLLTGKRSFMEGRDFYSFKVDKEEKARLDFVDSTGNTSGELTYFDDLEGRKITIDVQCDIRDYEYAEC